MGDKVSIVIPTRNRAALLRATLACVRAQTWRDREVIVVDEASGDGTPAMLDRDFPEVRIVRNREPQGPGAARNIGAAAANGDWLFFWDDDDLMHPGHLEALVVASRAAPPGSLVSGRARAFAVAGATAVFSPVMCAAQERTDAETLSDFFEPLRQRSIAHSTILWPRRLFATIKWDEELLFYEDFDLCGQAILAGHHIVGREVGMYYIRMHFGPRVTKGASVRRMLSPALYRLKWSALLQGRPGYEECAAALRNGLMQSIIELAGVPAATHLMPRLQAAFAAWGGKRYYPVNPPRHPAKRAIAQLTLQLAGPAALRGMLEMVARLRPSPPTYIEGLKPPDSAADRADANAIRPFFERERPEPAIQPLPAA